MEVGTATIPVVAAEVTGDEYTELWQRVTTAMPGFADYQKQTTRRIPLVALRPAT